MCLILLIPSTITKLRTLKQTMNNQLINTMSTMWSKTLDHANILSLVLALLTLLWAHRVAKKRSSGLPPGPCGLPLVGYLPFLGSELHHELAGLAARYGPIFKFWMGNKLCVVITSPELVKEVVQDQDTVFANRDITVSGMIVSYGANDIAFTPYGPVWKKLRKIFVREMLNNSILDNLYNLRHEEVRKSIKEIHGRVGEPMDMGNMAFLTAMNAILSMSCGMTIGADESAVFKKSAAEMMVLLGKPNVSDVFPAVARFDLQGIERDTRKVNRVFEEMFDWVVQKRKKMVSEARENGMNNGVIGDIRKDFLQLLLELNEQQDGSTPISDNELKAIITDTVLGATDTTATSVEWIMAELLNSPEAMNKVYEELTQVVGLNNIVEESHLSKLTYLNAVIKETFRLHPPVPFLLPRFPSKSTTIGGYKIPKGTKIFLNVWAIQRDPKNWENPSEFVPERFLSGDGAHVHFNSGNNFNYIPFGSGRRICAGLPLAERIVIHVLASFLHMFDWKLPPGSKLDLDDKFGIMLKKRETLIAIPTCRLSNPELYA